mmetsp:Transcript_14259/g.27751  ORF Transcript_14259/g.27751 Transcript_14259/m.27751 type:complete len:369 (+) Transcript_14259:120-1226(+)|eukprot:CAMPEP_0171332180 /NCGR_PEP_ID=MMETSP0878-20121228/3201_1 /TAXON_ID=67004 /ORGANISM="Thalassiosira weissflogii, Strain CCMP1336" /LENGTH=368 /DNA_ID=CAMNT_0011832879 /DNA_START=56 /DNA_END=1162 /DNA_ORIENTATION=+
MRFGLQIQLGIFSNLPWAYSFCFLRSSVRGCHSSNIPFRCSSPLQSPQNVDDATKNQKEVEWNFWGKPRSEKEIVDFVHDAIFSTTTEYQTGQDSTDTDASGKKTSNDRQWVEVISEEPPLLIVHGFLEPDFCDDIIQAVVDPDDETSTASTPPDLKNNKNSKALLRRSTMGADQTKSDERTSSTAWLREEQCPLPLKTVASRTSRLSGMPPSNMENLQVVRYEVGEEFQMHTDHLDSFNDFDVGGRLATCLVYLNDATVGDHAEFSSGNDDEKDGPDGLRENMKFTGGETFFHEFDVAVPPKKGSALFFWNTRERPGSTGYNSAMFLNVDRKLRHAGLPVLSGEKWVANRWIHPVDFGAGVRGLNQG